jgi:uncharacterized protein YigE (DUF2233 family)
MKHHLLFDTRHGCSQRAFGMLLLVGLCALSCVSCRNESRSELDAATASSNPDETSSQHADTSGVASDGETTAQAPLNPVVPKETEWLGDGEVKFSAPETLLEEGGVVLERQLWKFGDFDGIAWRVRAPLKTPLRVLSSAKLRAVEDFSASSEQGAWAILNGGFYESWPDGEQPYRAMGVVRSQGKEFSPYRHRGGSGVLFVEDGEPVILHRELYKKRGGEPPAQALQSIDRIISGGKPLVKKREGAKMAARSAVALTEKEVIFVALAARTSVREFDGGARLFKTSFLGLPLWAFADYVSASTGAREALNMDGAVSTQMMVRLDGESFKVIGERGVINAVELRLR